jgi:hypothetical protein
MSGGSRVDRPHLTERVLDDHRGSQRDAQTRSATDHSRTHILDLPKTAATSAANRDQMVTLTTDGTERAPSSTCRSPASPW